MNRMTKFAISSLMLGVSVIGCKPASDMRPMAISASAPKGDRAAAKFAAQASDALARRDAVTAVSFAERAVALAPRNADHRATLGQAYLLAGRFASAETAFNDALTLDSANGRAALSLALAEIALGRPEEAQKAIEAARGLAPAADVGLALALAGDRDRAIAMLESAARAEGASPKARQNLALAYALAGRWNEAQATAAVDVPADQMPERMMRWAKMAKASASADQVAMVLGVRPAADVGQPAQLALAPVSAEPVALAEAPVPAPAPVALVVPTPVVPAVVQPVEIAKSEIAPSESVLLTANAARPTPLQIAPARPDRAAKVPAMLASRQVARSVSRASRPAVQGRFVVQLGAFSSAERVEAAWSKVRARGRLLGGYTPSSSTFSRASSTYYRLSVTGFETRADAQRLCRKVKAAGGVCFVREHAGDAPVQWVSRDKREQMASR